MTSSSKSLASQLAVLSSIKKTKTHLSRNVKPSLLFSAKEASEIDDDTITTIGIQGFTELKNIDDRFEPFGEKIIFAHNDDFFERRLLSKEENAVLDKDINSFLSLISHHFLSPSSHKIIEFLLRKYEIHQYNTTSIIECILPYHEIRLFSRMLQVVWLGDDRWDFLKNAQTQGLTIPRVTIIKHAVKNLGFLQFICDLVLKQMLFKDHPNPHTLSFCSIILIQAIVTATKTRSKSTQNIGLTEPMIRIIISFIQSGIESNITKLQIISYMVLSQLCSNATLTKTALFPILLSLPCHVSKPNNLFCLLCMCHVFSTQEVLENLNNDYDEFFGLVMKNMKLHVSNGLKQVYEKGIDCRIFLHCFVNFFKKNKKNNDHVGSDNNDDNIKKMIHHLLKSIMSDKKKKNDYTKKRSRSIMNHNEKDIDNLDFHQSEFDFNFDFQLSLTKLVLSKINSEFFVKNSIKKQAELMIVLSESMTRGHGISSLVYSMIPTLPITDVCFHEVFSVLSKKVDSILNQKDKTKTIDFNNLPSVTLFARKQSPINVFSILEHTLEFLSISFSYETHHICFNVSLIQDLFNILNALQRIEKTEEIASETEERLFSIFQSCTELIFDSLLPLLKLIRKNNTNVGKDLVEETGRIKSEKSTKTFPVRKSVKTTKSVKKSHFIPPVTAIKSISNCVLKTSRSLFISPVFRNNSLLVLSEMGTFSAELAIHALNPILSLMSSHEYTSKLNEVLTFSVLQQSIEILFPPLICYCLPPTLTGSADFDKKKSNHNLLNHRDVSVKILTVFIDNLKNIPSSRTLVLLKLVIGALGQNYIHDTLCYSIEILLNDSDESSFLFTHKLLNEFTHLSQIYVLVALLKRKLISLPILVQLISLHFTRSTLVSYLTKSFGDNYDKENMIIPFEKIHTDDIIASTTTTKNFDLMFLSLFITLITDLYSILPEKEKKHYKNVSGLLALILEKLLKNSSFSVVVCFLLQDTKNIPSQRILKVISQRLKNVVDDDENEISTITSYEILIPRLHALLIENMQDKDKNKKIIAFHSLECINSILTLSRNINNISYVFLTDFINTIVDCFKVSTLFQLSLQCFQMLCSKHDVRQSSLSIFLKSFSNSNLSSDSSRNRNQNDITIVNLKSLFSFLSDIFKTLDRSELELLFIEIYEFYIVSFSFIIDSSNNNNNDYLVEYPVIFDSFTDLVLRFTESELKDIIVKLKEWAEIKIPVININNESDIETETDVFDIESSTCLRKQIIFCSLLYSLNERLTTLFIPYFTEILPFFLQCLTISNQLQQEKEKEFATLQSTILLCFRSLFSHVPSNYIGRDRMTRLKSPIINLIDNTKRLSYSKFIRERFIPCLVKFANCVSYDPYLLESLTSELLSHIKNDSSLVRETVVRILHEFFVSMGHSYLFLLPNLMPHLYNSLNDSEDNVREISFLLKKDVERLSGEDIDKYLNE